MKKFKQFINDNESNILKRGTSFTFTIAMFSKTENITPEIKDKVIAELKKYCFIDSDSNFMRHKYKHCAAWGL